MHTAYNCSFQELYFFLNYTHLLLAYHFSYAGSPFTCKIFKADHIIANESGLKTCHVNRPASIAIDSPSDSAVCKVTVVAPNGHQLPIDSSIKVDKKIVTKFTPIEVGKKDFWFLKEQIFL